MSLPSSGAISLDNIRTELGLSGAISFNTTDVRNLLAKTSGQISMSDAYSKALYYEFRIFGASGGKNGSLQVPGSGGYAMWKSSFTSGTNVDLYVGGKGQDAKTTAQGGTGRGGGGGGGGTAIVVAGQPLAIAGGGGGGGISVAGFTITYNGVSYQGGPGGGLSGLGRNVNTNYSGEGSQTAGGTIRTGRANPKPGTGPATGVAQTGGNGAFETATVYYGGWGFGSGGSTGDYTVAVGTDDAGGGGGGGYYGGAGGCADGNGWGVPGAGGSGFILAAAPPAGVGGLMDSALTTAAGTNYGNGYIEVYRLGAYQTTYNYTGAVQTITL